MVEARWLAWTLFVVYLAATYWLAWQGHKRTDSFKTFAVGNGAMGPGLAGVTLGACLASTATFVINPGFVYAYGLPALLALTLPFFAGIFAGLFTLGPGFRRHGGGVATLPVWIGRRYGSEGLRAYFAALSLLHVFYMVLIVVGAAFVLVATLGLEYKVAVTVVVGVVFSYVLLGGTYAHAYTNTAQGLLMLGVAVAIFVQAARGIGAPGEALAALSAQDPHLVGAVHPASPFYRDWLEVAVCPFLLGFAIVSQPHLLVKSLYVKSHRDVLLMSATGGVCFVVFSLVLFAGLAARVSLGPGLNQDVAMTTWLASAFPGHLGAFIGVTILAAAMSTLDGLLVAVSCIVGGDLVAHPAVARRLGLDTEEARERAALRAGRWTVLVLGGAAWLISLSPPKLVGIFGTVGTYGLLAASLPAIVYGVLRARPPAAWTMVVASIVALAVHLGLYLTVTENTGLTASAALVVAMPLPLVLDLVGRRAPAVDEAAAPAQSETLCV